MGATIDFIEVFKTNIDDPAVARKVTACLSSAFEGAQINFDLEDVDRILRIASTQEIQPALITSVVMSFGFQADVLPDIIDEPAQARFEAHPAGPTKSKI